ncbi:colicin-N [Paramixta manurensis]|uniref:Colicin-N n=2 Tax=Paramixta manurensis TaxID=2740817 RepID=A0A6M8U9Q6_9GAMM|nr:colicin-N [Erwiniaceae bacterium PD-1]
MINLVRQKQAEEKASNGKDALNKASTLVADMGEKVGAYLGQKYKFIANEIASDIKNFQGKRIRSFNEAMKSLNKVTQNPEMKINRNDRQAIVNAWKHINAADMANKLGNLSKAFKVADVVIKVEKVRQKSIEGYETGNWGPLLLEVESWVVSGIVAGVALALFSSMVSLFTVAGTFPATAIMILGILSISWMASYIDEKLVDKINHQLIRNVY